MNNRELLYALSQPFNPVHITWKPGAFNRDKSKALALAYADLRAYMQRLDEVCGLDWSVSYTPWGDRIICNLTILDVTRSSTGEPDSQSEKSEIAGTAAEAQAFKRACAMFGLGRYLYNLPSIWAEYDQEKKQFSEQGKARLNGIVIQHYRRHVQESEDTGISVATHQNNGNGVHKDDTEPQTDLLKDSQLSDLEDFSRLLYEDAWQNEMKRLTKFVTQERTDDHRQLQTAEAQKLIDGLAKKLNGRLPIIS
jgi:hypothetical protein